jgi:hypothetical protein
MKIFYLFILLTFSTFSFSQIINIPDANFKAKLLQADVTNIIAQDDSENNLKIDTNNNSEIEVSEALTVYNLTISNSNISDLTGVESFTNLGFLDCSYNNLNHFNYTIPNNVYVIATHNQIINLSISGTMFSECDFSYNNLQTVTLNNVTAGGGGFSFNHNQITSFNITGNIYISHGLYLQSNLINEIDITGLNFYSGYSAIYLNNNPLTKLISTGHALNLINIENISSSYLDLTEYKDPVGGNSEYNSTEIEFINCPNLQTIYAKNEYNFFMNCWQQMGETVCSDNVFVRIQNCPNLNFFCVDEGEKQYIENQINQLGLQNQVQVNSNCSFLDNTSFENSNVFKIYPVPSSDILNISNTNQYEIQTIEIYNQLGQIVQKELGNVFQINVSQLQNGAYFLKIKTENSVYTKQFIKE